jgi:hypothetical protein
VVVDGESLWLYDGEHERWVYCDGTRLSMFAAERDPAPVEPEQARKAPGRSRGVREAAPDGHEPTRLVTYDEDDRGDV